MTKAHTSALEKSLNVLFNDMALIVRRCLTSELYFQLNDW